MSEPQGVEPEPHLSRQLVAEGQRWDVLVEPHVDADGHAKVAYVFRTHDPRPGRPAEERRRVGYFAPLPVMSAEALLALFRDAE